MKIEVSMTTVDKALFEVNRWWATKPDFVLETLRAQLAAAAVIWPELKVYRIGEKKPKAPAHAP